MLDFSFGELAVTSLIALVVLGPERLPKVARTVGEWAGKAQRYVSQVKSDIDRELELSELKKLQEQARDAARSIESSVQGGVANLESGLQSTAAELGSALPSGDSPATALDSAWEQQDAWRNYRFDRRYKPGPGIDDLAEEVLILRRRLANFESRGQFRGKYAPRARVSRPRIRR
jgi:sec-independent protein translocase protein TatB